MPKAMFGLGFPLQSLPYRGKKNSGKCQKNNESCVNLSGMFKRTGRTFAF